MFKKLNIHLTSIILLGFLLRVISIVLFHDVSVDNEWGVLLKNLEENKTLSVRTIKGELVPNIFMPPLYPFFLFIIKKFVSDIHIFLYVTQFIQLMLSLVSIYFIYKILIQFFSNNISYIGTFIFSVFPLNVYAISQISSITLQVFLLTVFLLCFIKIFKKHEKKYLLFFSVSAGLLILLRGEFFIFFLFSMIYLYLKTKNIKQIILSIILTVIIISPYLIRNYQIFEVITVTKSGGFNLLKGNNPSTKVEGIVMFRKVHKIVPEVKSKLEKLNPDNKYDLIVDKIFFDQALEFIKDNPKKYIYLYFKKALAFIFIDIDSSYPNYYSPLHIIPKLLISITTIFSILFLFRFKINLYNYLIIYYFMSVGLFSLFFILPRYNLFLLPIQIIFATYFIEYISKKFKISSFL